MAAIALETGTGQELLSFRLATPQGCLSMLESLAKGHRLRSLGQRRQRLGGLLIFLRRQTFNPMP